MQTLYLYNTLSRQKEEFQPISNGEARLYTCGPTVYDYAHIGNFRAYLFSDMLRRMLEYNGYKVTHAMNITDVGHLVGDSDAGEDKIEVASRREGKHPLEIARKYEVRFFEDGDKLNIKRPTTVLRATETVPQQIEIIERLMEKGFAYQTEQAIYFDTAKLADYGKLTGQRLEEKQQAAREEVVVDSQKRHPQDFALWFFLVGRYERHILHWPSPWGEGFPGWHIECSAISRKLLGQPFDIHTGGVDHIGTHHTNEIAQSEAAFEVPLAHYWLHSEFLLVEGKRMGKSEGNLFTLTDLEKKGFAPLDFRYLCLTAHYRSKMNFTWEALEGARKTRQGIQELISQGGEQGNETEKDSILEAFNDDLDSPKALALLHEAKDSQLWLEFDSMLGLDLTSEKKETPLEYPQEALELLQERDRARGAQDWARADSVRGRLAEMGFQVIDTPTGSQLRRKN